MKELKRGGRVGHENKNGQLVELGDHTGPTGRSVFGRCGPGPEIQTLYLQLLLTLVKTGLFN